MVDLVVATYAVAVAEKLGWDDERLIAIREGTSDPELVKFVAANLAEGDPFGRPLKGPDDWCEALAQVAAVIQPIA